MFSGNLLNSVYKKWITALQVVMGELCKKCVTIDPPYKLTISDIEQHSNMSVNYKYLDIFHS